MNVRIAYWRTGLALALTMMASYTVCALFYAQWPQAGIRFLNMLFHGLDFNRLVDPAPLTLSVFLVPLFLLALWGFLVGTLFSWLRDRLRPEN